MATITSAASGLWSATTTWTGGVLPAAGDQVDITHTVTYDLDNRTTLYGRININAGGTLIHDNTKATTIACAKYLRVNGGTYQAGPNSKTLFYTPNNSTSTEGGGLAGLYIEGGVNNTKFIMEGSIPLPETNLTQAVAIGDYILKVADASKFAQGEYISVYHDQKDDTTWNWANDNYKNDEGFIVHHISGNDIYIQQRVSIQDTTTSAMSIGGNTVSVSNIKKWQVGFKTYIDNEVFTIQSVDETTNTLTFTTAATVAHSSGAKMIETGAQKVHAVGDHVYKIATVLTANSSANTNTITVANASMLDVGDRIVVEGPSRYIGREFEAKITAKNGNTLTLEKNNTYAVSTGFLVTKTNRDCVIATTDYDAVTPDDLNRCFIYYIHGSSSITGRKCIMRYVEVARTGHSNETYGCTFRGDFNRTDTEREIRGCSIRDGRNIGRNGLWMYSIHYFPVRNNVIVKTNRGINPYDQNGGFYFNNIAMGQHHAGYTYESQYYQSLFQYNIATNGTYAFTWSGDYNATYPEWHNIFKHYERGLWFTNSATGQQYGSFMKNSLQDIYYRHQYVEGARIVVQENEITYASDATWNNLSSSYANYDDRHLVGGMLVLMNKDFTRGYFEMHSGGGIITRDMNVHMGNGWSYQFDCNNSAVDLRISEMIYAKQGVPVTVRAYMRKDASYNGTVRPCIVARGIYQPKIQQEMPNVNDEWQRVEMTFTPTRSELVQIGVGARGTAGYAWIDPRVSVTCHDLDLISGPYSVNLMFGLEQYSGDINNPSNLSTASIVLGGGMTL